MSKQYTQYCALGLNPNYCCHPVNVIFIELFPPIFLLPPKTIQLSEERLAEIAHFSQQLAVM